MFVLSPLAESWPICRMQSNRSLRCIGLPLGARVLIKLRCPDSCLEGGVRRFRLQGYLSKSGRIKRTGLKFQEIGWKVMEIIKDLLLPSHISAILLFFGRRFVAR